MGSDSYRILVYRDGLPEHAAPSIKRGDLL